MRTGTALFCAMVLMSGLGCKSDGLLSPNVLTFTASSQLVPYPGLRDPLPAVEATILITNDRDTPITFNYSRCPGLGLRAFATADLSGTPLWSSDTNVVCTAIGYAPSVLDPGKSVQLVIYGMVSSILGADRPNGTYYIDAFLEVGGGDIRPSTVHVPAGAVQLTR